MNAPALPSEGELRAFAHAASALLLDRVPRLAGARAVARRAGVGLQHLDHREYQPGDEIRHIDWRVTARTRRPMLRRFESESASDWMLLLDASSSMAGADDAKWRGARSSAAAMAYALLGLGHRVGLLAFGGRVIAQCPPGRGQHQYAAIVRVLASLEPAASGEGTELGVCVRHLAGATSVFVISDFLADDELRRDLALLRTRCRELHALQVSSPADVRLAATGEVDIVDIETRRRLHVVAGAAGEHAAADARASMTARLRAYCALSGVAFSDWDPGRPWQRALLQHLVRARAQC